MARAIDDFYKIHVHDFSTADQICLPDIRGTYHGFVYGSLAHDSHGTSINHLKELGVTAVHLMPVQDFLAAPNAYNSADDVEAMKLLKKSRNVVINRGSCWWLIVFLQGNSWTQSVKLPSWGST